MNKLNFSSTGYANGVRLKRLKDEEDVAASQVKELMKKYKNYLAENDLVGFYSQLESEWENTMDFPGSLISKVSQVFEDNGVDPLKYFPANSSLPQCYNIARPISKYLEFGGVLKLPHNIKYIGEAAFMDSWGFEVADLRNLNGVDAIAFRGCKQLREIILPKSLDMCYANSFRTSNIETVIKVPEDVDKTLKSTLANYTVEYY